MFDAPINDRRAGTTVADVASPEREARRNKARALRAQGRSLGQIADQLGVTRSVIQDDLRDQPKAPPLSVRFPADVETAAREAAARKGVSLSQFVIESVRGRLAHQERNRAMIAEKRAQARKTDDPPGCG